MVTRTKCDGVEVRLNFGESVLGHRSRTSHMVYSFELRPVFAAPHFHPQSPASTVYLIFSSHVRRLP